MSGHLQYDDELLKRMNDLQLPGEDAAWEDMKRRLDKDNNDKPVVPPLLKSCGSYALLLLLLIAIAYLFIADPGNWFHNKNHTPPVDTSRIESKKKNNTNKIISNSKQAVDSAIDKTVAKPKRDLNQKIITGSATAKNSPDEKIKTINGNTSFSSRIKAPTKYTSLYKKHGVNDGLFNGQKNEHAIKIRGRHLQVIKKIKGRIKSAVSGNLAEDAVKKELNNVKEIGEIVLTKAGNTISKIPSKTKPGIDSLKKHITATSALIAKAKPEPVKQDRIYLSAGLGIHQLLPVAGQKSNAYNSLGRTNFLADYLPSIYLRMNKNKKWFVQSEFRYGAPQYTKEIIFSQKKIIDTNTLSAITTNNTIKKTFYHQLPVSFNYFVLPGLSIGAGVSFNKFTSAIVQQDVRKSNTVTQTDSLLSSGIISQKKADSNFVTSYLQALIETQYQWKRFSTGARYSFGLQPFLKFKLPGGNERKEKNSSLQLFIHYQFWRSVKK